MTVMRKGVKAWVAAGQGRLQTAFNVCFGLVIGLLLGLYVVAPKVGGSRRRRGADV